MIIVSSLGPPGDLNTRRICKTLQRTLPGLPLIVVAWTGDSAAALPPTEAAHTVLHGNREVIAAVKSLVAVQPPRDASTAPAPSGT